MSTANLELAAREELAGREDVGRELHPCTALMGYTSRRATIFHEDAVKPARGHRVTMRRAFKVDTCSRCLGAGVILGESLKGRVNGAIRRYCPDCNGEGGEP